jgi:spermidine/putrescine transport system ATP-binding protein
MEGGGTPDVRLTGVTKVFGDDIVAVDRVDLDVRNGEFLALLGPSGCGKTTTLRLIAGFEEPTEGEIEIGGRSAVGIPPHKRDVNTVFQQYALFPHMTVLDNVAYGLKQRKVDKAQRRRQAGEALELVRLTGRETAKPAELSGGMQQRVALARALVLRPKVLLLDEPLGALDKKLRDAMQIELKRIQRDVGITFIVVTHDQEEAMAMADRIAVMYDGRIDQLGGPSEIYDHPATPFVADFIGDMNHLEGTLARDGERLVCDVDGARFGIGLVVEEAEIGRRVRIGVRPEELHARAGTGEGAEATVQTAMVLGHDLQVVARLGGGAEVMARQPRTGDDGVSAVMPGEKVRLSWSPTAALLLGPADPDRPPANATQEPLELPA